MVCIYCSNQTNVTNSRHQKRNNTVWRRRECKACQSVITTVERPNLATAISVKTHSKALQPFDGTKLLISVYSTLKHRKTASDDATALCLTITKDVYDKSHQGTINKEQIANTVYQVLSRFDDAAASHYKAFHSQVLATSD